VKNWSECRSQIKKKHDKNNQQTQNNSVEILHIIAKLSVLAGFTSLRPCLTRDSAHRPRCWLNPQTPIASHYRAGRGPLFFPASGTSSANRQTDLHVLYLVLSLGESDGGKLASALAEWHLSLDLVLNQLWVGRTATHAHLTNTAQYILSLVNVNQSIDWFDQSVRPRQTDDRFTARLASWQESNWRGTAAHLKFLTVKKS